MGVNGLYHSKGAANAMVVDPQCGCQSLLSLSTSLWANRHVAMFVWAVSGLKVSFAGFLYVDDGNLATVACTPNESELSMVA